MHFDLLIRSYFDMEKQQLQEIIQQAISQSMSFDEYVTLVQTLTDTADSSGPNKSESYINYTKLGNQRMKRLIKTVNLPEEYAAKMKQINGSQTWLVITESWCGDAAQIIPMLQKMANENELIDTRFVLRDENLELMDQFLTRGGRSIPKLIVLDENFEVLGSWGPRPQEAQMLYDTWKQEENPRTYQEFSIELQKWYTQDKGESTFSEIMDILEKSEAQPK